MRGSGEDECSDCETEDCDHIEPCEGGQPDRARHLATGPEEVWPEDRTDSSGEEDAAERAASQGRSTDFRRRVTRQEHRNVTCAEHGAAKKQCCKAALDSSYDHQHSSDETQHIAEHQALSAPRDPRMTRDQQRRSSGSQNQHPEREASCRLSARQLCTKQSTGGSTCGKPDAADGCCDCQHDERSEARAVWFCVGIVHVPNLMRGPCRTQGRHGDLRCATRSIYQSLLHHDSALSRYVHAYQKVVCCDSIRSKGE